MTTTLTPPVEAPPEREAFDDVQPAAAASPLKESLLAVAKSMRAAFVGPPIPEAGQPVVAAVQPTPSTIEVAEVLSGKLDLTWITKNVVFDNSNVQTNFLPEEIDATTGAGQPVADNTVVKSDTTPGVIATLQGAIPFVTAIQVPISATVTWEVLDAKGENVITDDGQVFKAANGLTGLDLSVLFAPALVAAGSKTEPARYKLRATVTLSANGQSAPAVPLPMLDIVVPALEVPTVVAMFVHSNFQPRDGDDDGGALVVVPPGSSAGGLSELQGMLNKLHKALNSLTAFPRFAGFLLGLGELTSALSAHRSASIQFRETKEIPNLNDITLVQRDWYENDTEAEDEISSIIIIGWSGAGAQFWIDRNYKGPDFTLKTGELHLAMMRSLHGNAPNVEFGTAVPSPPVGFADRLSALKLV